MVQAGACGRPLGGWRCSSGAAAGAAGAAVGVSRLCTRALLPLHCPRGWSLKGCRSEVTCKGRSCGRQPAGRQPAAREGPHRQHAAVAARPGSQAMQLGASCASHTAAAASPAASPAALPRWVQHHPAQAPAAAWHAPAWPVTPTGGTYQTAMHQAAQPLRSNGCCHQQPAAAMAAEHQRASSLPRALGPAAGLGLPGISTCSCRRHVCTAAHVLPALPPPPCCATVECTAGRASAAARCPEAARRCPL